MGIITKRADIAIPVPSSNIYGYDFWRKSLLSLDDDSLQAVQHSISMSQRDYTVMFNTITSYYFLKGFTLTSPHKLSMKSLDDIYEIITNTLKRESPLEFNAIKQTLLLVNRIFNERKQHNKNLDTVCYAGRTIQLMSVKDRVYCCFNIFSQAWADKYRIPSWVAFMVDTGLMDDDHVSLLDLTLNGQLKIDNLYVDINDTDSIYTTILSTHHLKLENKQHSERWAASDNLQ